MKPAKYALISLIAGVAVSALTPAMAAPASADAMPAEFTARIGASKSAMMSNPDVALAEARAAGAVARSMRGEKAELAKATSLWLEGEATTRLNQPQKAKPIVEAALALAIAHAPNSKLHGDILKSRAGIAAIAGDPQGALLMLHQAHAIYGKLGEARAQAIALQQMGSIYSEARDYPRVLQYYEQAAEIFSADPALTLSSHNNRGNAYKAMGEFGKAEQAFAQALKVAREMHSPLLEARILTNLAEAQVAQGRLAQADATAAAGLELTSGGAAEWGPYLWGVRAQVAHARGDARGALRLIERTFSGVDLETSTMSYREFHATAQHIYEALGRHREALRHLKAYKRLSDEGREVAASVNAALMGARFDAANQNLRIAKLKAQKAEREVKLARSEQRLRLITWLTAIGGVAAAIVIAAILFAFAAARRSRRVVSAANAQLTYAVRHDNLTGLPNRAYFRELLDSALKQGDRSALMLIDLDRFKAVNDTLGHNAGDELLVAVARRLEGVVGATGHAARLGGDEFAVVVPGATGPQAGLASQIIAELSRPYDVGGGSATIGATVSIAFGPADGATVDGLTQSADLALYRAKEAGRGRFAHYEPWMRNEAAERRALEADLRHALVNDELTLAYQPIVEAATGKIVAYEALLRWDHPERGPIAPAVFVPIAEETRLINELGAWVLRTACTEAATWPEEMKVAVNISALQVEAESLTATIVSALATSGLAPHRLELEMTESVFLRQGVRSEQTLESLRTLGVSLALDDFGTGYSSLSYLPRASFSKVKIDRSFVQSAAEGCHVSIAIIQSIVALAQGLGMEITAEGVESKRETALMRKLGCSQLQGYLIGRPEGRKNRPHAAPVAAPETLAQPKERRTARRSRAA